MLRAHESFYCILLQDWGKISIPNRKILRFTPRCFPSLGKYPQKNQLVLLKKYPPIGQELACADFFLRLPKVGKGVLEKWTIFNHLLPLSYFLNLFSASNESFSHQQKKKR